MDVIGEWGSEANNTGKLVKSIYIEQITTGQLDLNSI